MKSNVCLKTLAIELGLSVNAVSRALRDCDDISKKTKELVMKKAIELKYKPNVSARTLKTGKTFTIGIIVDSLCSKYFALTIEYMIQYFKDAGYNTLIFCTKSLLVDKYDIKEVLNMNVDGIVSFFIPTQKSIDFVRLNMVPMLVFGRYIDEKGIDVIYTDDVMGGELACSYLSKVTKTNKICFVGIDEIECSKRRELGFFNKAKDFNINEIIKIDGNNVRNEFLKVVEEGYDSFFCFDDELASIICSVNKGQHNINVVGYNGLSKFSLNIFNITSIESDIEKMASDACNLLIKQINNYDIEPEIRCYPVKLYLGDS